MKTCPLCDAAYPNHHSNCDKDGALLIESRDLEPGTVIRGKYRVVRLLGHGGMGTVYLAEHILLGQQRALKFISSELSQDAGFLKRFRHEAQAAIKLRHPNVVEVVDLDQAEDGSPYIAMEYVEGEDLRHALAASHPQNECHPERSAAGSKDLRLPFGAFPVERALAIARGIAQGLGAAHLKGIVHRDVKPENILLAGGNGAPETPKLLDFGIAAIEESSTAVSRTRGLLLTPPYAAPEQWQGMSSEQLDGRADLYALGGVLYEMLAGQTCFHAYNTEGWMHQHLHEEPQPPSRLRPELANWTGLDALVRRLLAKDREQRPNDVAETIRFIDAVVYVPPPIARLITAQESPRTVVDRGGEKAARRVPVWVWVSAVALLLVAAFAAERIFAPQPPKAPQEAASQTAPVALPQPAEPSPARDSSPKPSDPRLIARQERGPQTAAIPGATTDPTGYWKIVPPQQPQTVAITGATTNAAMLLVTCDLACDWKLDGEAKGRIDANGSAKEKVEPTQHVVAAATEDGADQVKRVIEIKGNGQTVVNIELKPVRDTRLEAEQEARDKAAREQQEKEQREREAAAREEAERQSWTDPATGLMWAKKDNGSDVTWQQAMDYCRNLQLAGHSGWRLATIDELEGNYDPNANVGGWHVKGNLRLSGWQWSNSPGDASGEAWYFYFSYGKRISHHLGDSYFTRALCVRRSGV